MTEPEYKIRTWINEMRDGLVIQYRRFEATGSSARIKKYGAVFVIPLEDLMADEREIMPGGDYQERLVRIGPEPMPGLAPITKAYPQSDKCGRVE